MKQKKECVAMLLAGGEGRRLECLTKNLAKPAVSFGGKYRIIDFPLSNCTNSGIDTVGVLTQYQPLVLNSYIGIGSAWDLDRIHGGVSLLPPYMVQGGGDWYKGTANAIYQNIAFIEQYSPDYVLILSGDHIYKMDYSQMIRYHAEKGAEATIAVLEVPWEETHRFGIMNTNEDYVITEFEEKPKHAKNNLASMGVYVFDWKWLKYYLEEDAKDPLSSNDFGKDIIPMMLSDQKKLVAYPFKGYWKDVGTVASLWEANMDLIAENPELNLFDRSWKIYSVNPNRPPQYISPDANVTRSLVNEGCMIYGEVDHSVVFPGVTIGHNSVIKDSVIMPDVTIGDHVHIEKAIIGSGTIIESGARLQGESEQKILLIGENMMVNPEGRISEQNTLQNNKN